MKSDRLTAFLRVVVVAAATGLVASACGSRPIAARDGGGDAATAGTSGGAGNGGANGGAGNGGAGNGGAGNGGAGIGAGSGGSGGGGNATAGSAGTSGIAGATGTAGKGGTAGTGASGGRGGSASGGSSGGASGGRGGGGGGAAGGPGGAAGGRGGAGGTGVPGPECATASDCKLVSDCCTCEAIPVGATAAACPPTCQLFQCEARQLPAGAVACVAGRCVAGFACDSTNVTCKVAPPTCPAGVVPVVNDAGNCYLGTCAPPSECTAVAGCGSCTGAGEACVTYQTQLGNQHHCVAIPPECNGAATCGCFGATTCLSPYRSCTESSGLKGVACSCPNC